MSAWRPVSTAVVLTAALGALRPARAQQMDVIRGRILGADSTPIRAANVKATSYQGGVSKETVTDKNGRYTIVIVNGEGDYWIDVTKIGYAPRRFEIRRIGDEEVLIANARLSAATTTLGKVDVTARRSRNLSRSANAPDIGGGDRPVATNALPPDQAGNLAAMASTVAGIQLIPGLDGATDVFSMLGLTGDQNNTTFEGLGSSVTALPPDFLATTIIRPYPFDPSIGGFSGAQVSVQSIPGSNFSRRAITNVDILPPLEWADEAAIAQGQQYTNARLGGNAAGPIVMDRAFYNVGYNVGRQFSDLRTLENTGAVGLTAAGIAPDSAARLIGILRQRQIPVDPTSPFAFQARNVGQVAGNLDVSPDASGANTFTLAGAFAYQGTEPVSPGGLLLTTPAHASNATFWSGNLVATHSKYFDAGILSKTTLGLAAGDNITAPFDDIPQGSVLVDSRLADGTSSVKNLLFGGGAGQSSQQSRAVQLTNQLMWFSDDDAHAVKLTSGVTEDAAASTATQAPFGAFTFNSLAALDANQPASFTRALDQVSARTRQVSGFASLSDAWRPTDDLQIEYGLRADGNRFLETPASNPDVFGALGASNGAVPNRVYVSPRLGMQWYYGQSPQVGYAAGSARPPRAVVHAGIGAFQNVGSSQLIMPAITSTGLPGSTRTITCVGAATPTPDWHAYTLNAASIPTACADGSPGSVLATAAPNVTLFDRGFRQPHSIRGAADWSSPILDNRLVLGVQSIVSSGVDQQALVDVNLDTTARFHLADEGGRPVFVDPTGIVPATGAVSIVTSRRSGDFQHVWMDQSAFKLQSQQVTLDLSPVTSNPWLHWDVTYTLLNTRQTFTGFTSTTGNPFDVQSGLDQQAGRHTLTLFWNNLPIHDLVYLTAAVRFASGVPFTPMIASDVNGDGVANDRAFVFDPAKTADTALAHGMSALLTSASPALRRCLDRQLDALAGRGTCQGPWTAFGVMLVRFNPEKIGLPKRATVTLALQNPFTLADLMLHGGNDLHGWGQNIPPDQNLLFVRGFDPTTRRFEYTVNQRFGSTRPLQSATYALPFVSVGVTLDVGVPRERQLLTQRLDIGRRVPGTTSTDDAMRTFGVTTIPNPMFLILQQADALGLTRAQADSLATLSRAFSQFADSVWTPVGRYLATLPKTYSTRDAYERFVSARARTVDFLITLVPDARSVLTPAQRRRLPSQISNFLDVRVLRFLRTSTAGDGGAVFLR